MDKIVKGVGGLSKSQATSSILKIVDIAVLAGIGAAGAVLPGAAYEFSKLGLGKLRDYIHARDDRRIYEFHKKLLCRDDMVDEELLAGEIEEANYHALLNACLADIEDEKTTAYANLTRAIASKKVSSELRRYFTLALKDIAWEDLDLLKRLYVINNNPIIASAGNGTLSSEDYLLKYSEGSAHRLSVTTLLAKGFVTEKEISGVGSLFVKACSSGDDLTPGVYGYRTWSGHVCDTYFLDQSGYAYNVLELIQKQLHDKLIKCGAAPGEGVLTRGDKNMYSTCAVVLYRNGKVLDSPKLENLKHQLGNKPVVQVIMDDDNLGVVETLLPGESVVVNSADAFGGVLEAIGKLITEVNARHQARENLKRS